MLLAFDLLQRLTFEEVRLRAPQCLPRCARALESSIALMLALALLLILVLMPTLFVSGWFAQGENISRFSVLCALATQLGVKEPVAFLRSKQHQQEARSPSTLPRIQPLAHPAPPVPSARRGPHGGIARRRRTRGGAADSVCARRDT